MCDKSFCKHIKGKLFDDEISQTWNEGYRNFLFSDQPYLYDFSHEETNHDYECSYLSIVIFWNLAQKKEKYKKSDIIIDQKEYRGGRTKYDSKGEGNWYYYDVMHNATVDKNRKGKLATKLGEKSVIRLQWEKVYHTIGNFSPVPYAKNRQINFIHHDMNEWWEPTLKFMKDYWGDWEISFDEYIKMTIQQMYYKCNFEEIYSEYEKIILESNPKDLIGILETKLIEEDWDKKLQKWESKSDLIDLNDYAKTDGDKARIIIFLILMRGIAICSVLKKEEKIKMNFEKYIEFTEVDYKFVKSDRIRVDTYKNNFQRLMENVLSNIQIEKSSFKIWKDWKIKGGMDPDDSDFNHPNKFMRVIYYVLWGKKIDVGKMLENEKESKYIYMRMDGDALAPAMFIMLMIKNIYGVERP